MSDPVVDEPFGQDGAGEPDGFRRLWMPHRMAYIKGENRATGDSPEECPFCRAPKLPDADGLIVARGTSVFTVLNLYPYNAGHLMVCPYRHVADYTDLDPAVTTELGPGPAGFPGGRPRAGTGYSLAALTTLSARCDGSGS